MLKPFRENKCSNHAGKTNPQILQVKMKSSRQTGKIRLTYSSFCCKTYIFLQPWQSRKPTCSSLPRRKETKQKANCLYEQLRVKGENSFFVVSMIYVALANEKNKIITITHKKIVLVLQVQEMYFKGEKNNSGVSKPVQINP